ncbi:MAG: cysteine hydrolase [Chloroflexi bacterium]|nr:cysteine hydrolase [Chloroflexota bacterium]
MIALTDNTALIIIDVQDGLDEPRLGTRNNPDAEGNIVRLLAGWRAQGRPIYYVQHMSTEPNSPLRPDLPGNAIKRIVAPHGAEPVIQKSVNSAFIGTDLEQRLRAAGIQTVVLVGLVTDHCVSTTARMAGNLGFTTFVVDDATATFERSGPDGTTYPAEIVHAVELASLHGEFATVVKTDQLLAVAHAAD